VQLPTADIDEPARRWIIPRRSGHLRLRGYEQQKKKLHASVRR
jgi:hypothetical protein